MSDRMDAISWLPPLASTSVEVVLVYCLTDTPPSFVYFAPTLAKRVLYSNSIFSENWVLDPASLASILLRISSSPPNLADLI